MVMSRGEGQISTSVMQCILRGRCSNFCQKFLPSLFGPPSFRMTMSASAQLKFQANCLGQPMVVEATCLDSFGADIACNHWFNMAGAVGL
jgi:hypothetical protein